MYFQFTKSFCTYHYGYIWLIKNLLDSHRNTSFPNHPEEKSRKFASNLCCISTGNRELHLKTPADAAGFVSGFQDPSDIPQRQQAKPAPCHPPHQAREFGISCPKAMGVKPSTGLSCAATLTLQSTRVWFGDGCPPSGNKFFTTALLSSL